MFDFKFDTKKLSFEKNYIEFAFVPWDSKYLKTKISTINKINLKDQGNFSILYQKFLKMNMKNCLKNFLRQINEI